MNSGDNIYTAPGPTGGCFPLQGTVVLMQAPVSRKTGGNMDKTQGRSGLRRGFGWTGVNMYPGFETAALLTKKALSDMASANAQYG